MSISSTTSFESENEAAIPEVVNDSGEKNLWDMIADYIRSSSKAKAHDANIGDPVWILQPLSL